MREEVKRAAEIKRGSKLQGNGVWEKKEKQQWKEKEIHMLVEYKGVNVKPWYKRACVKTTQKLQGLTGC